MFRVSTVVFNPPRSKLIMLSIGGKVDGDGGGGGGGRVRFQFHLSANFLFRDAAFIPFISQITILEDRKMGFDKSKIKPIINLCSLLYNVTR